MHTRFKHQTNGISYHFWHILFYSFFSWMEPFKSFEHANGELYDDRPLYLIFHQHSNLREKNAKIRSNRERERYIKICQLHLFACMHISSVPWVNRLHLTWFSEYKKRWKWKLLIFTVSRSLTSYNLQHSVYTFKHMLATYSFIISLCHVCLSTLFKLNYTIHITMATRKNKLYLNWR